MRLPNAAHESHRWRIGEIAPDFTVLDVWALPAQGGRDDFPLLLDLMTSLDPADASRVSHLLFAIRWQLGRWFGWDDAAGPLPIPDDEETSLADRLPDDLRDTVAGVEPGRLPFVPLFRTDDESVAELSNQTVHGVLHLAWVDQGDGRYQGQLTVYVKPRGQLGKGYLALIAPFRHWFVYPSLMRQIGRAWDARSQHAGGVRATAPQGR